MREEYADDAPFIGKRCNCPARSFRVGRDVYAGYFIVVRRADGNLRPFWIARALSDPDSNQEHPNCVEIQYWRPANMANHVQDTYKGWDASKPFIGRKMIHNLIQDWLHTDSIMSSLKSNI